jgi:hypothetical protein
VSALVAPRSARFRVLWRLLCRVRRAHSPGEHAAAPVGGRSNYPQRLGAPPLGGGVEDPRVTYVAPLRCYVMTYTAYVPHHPRVALARSGQVFRTLRVRGVHPGAAGRAA